MPFGINRGGGEREKGYCMSITLGERKFVILGDMISCRTILLFSWIGKVFVIIYGGKVRGKNMVDVLCV